MKKSTHQAILFCWLVLFSMFILRLWFTILWVILFAVVMTFTQKKRSYCSHVCPVGYIQDRSYKPRDTGSRMVNHPGLLRKLFFMLFWAYLILSIVLFYNQTNILWASMLILLLFSFFTALLLQLIYRKRFWCSYTCPVGSVLKSIVKFRYRQQLNN